MHFFKKDTPVSQVKFNRLDPNILATSHSGEIRLWDMRSDKDEMPSITAHRTKIQSIAWSPTSASTLLSCASDDNCVKIWVRDRYRSRFGNPI